jgi:luciferase family oxidoreductase group 1
LAALSILELAWVTEGSTVGVALHNAVDLAQHAEKWGYTRFWLAEHHNSPAIASAATAVAIGHVAGGTQKIRVGSGGIMLPNHSPLVIAEQFGTLASLYPDRIDLGLGRAPGTDMMTVRALRRDPNDAENFPQDVIELQALLGPPLEGQRVFAVPGMDTNVPLWILGSSLFGAQLAAHLGLPYAFASHFAPDAMMKALEIYRERFKPSKQLDKPYVMVGCSVVAADTDKNAKYLYSSMQILLGNITRGERAPLGPPVEDIDSRLSDADRGLAGSMRRFAFVGGPEKVKSDLENFAAMTKADEIMIAGMTYDHQARLRSYEITANVAKQLGWL